MCICNSRLGAVLTQYVGDLLLLSSKPVPLEVTAAINFREGPRGIACILCLSLNVAVSMRWGFSGPLNCVFQNHETIYSC